MSIVFWSPNLSSLLTFICWNEWPWADVCVCVCVYIETVTFPGSLIPPLICFYSLHIPNLCRLCASSSTFTVLSSSSFCPMRSLAAGALRFGPRRPGFKTQSVPTVARRTCFESYGAAVLWSDCGGGSWTESWHQLQSWCIAELSLTPAIFMNSRSRRISMLVVLGIQPHWLRNRFNSLISIWIDAICQHGLTSPAVLSTRQKWV